MKLKSFVSKLRNSLQAPPRPKLRPRLAGSIAAILVCALIILWVFSSDSGAPGFPNIAPGKYVGLIEVPDIPKLAKTTLYFERSGSKHAITTVVFVEDWLPKRTPLFLPAGLASNAKGQGYAALKLSIQGHELQLSGAAAGKEYRGIVSENGVLRGTWMLRPIADAELHEKARLSQTDFEWLRLKGLHSLRTSELETLETENRKNKAKLDTLQSEEMLGELTAVQAQEIKEIESSLEALRTRQTQYAERISELIREINQLQRITLEGRVVGLARRVQTREDKWYSVNWVDAQSAQANEQIVAQEMGVNIRSLNTQLDEAQEIQELRNTIANEKARIRALRKEYRKKIQSPDTQEQAPGQDSPEEPGKPWWKRWDTVFGLSGQVKVDR